MTVSRLSFAALFVAVAAMCPAQNGITGERKKYADEIRESYSFPFGKGLISTPGNAAGEGNDFIRRGGVIAFVIDSRRVRFDINLKAATGAGLKLSSKLLAVARSIER